MIRVAPVLPVRTVGTTTGETDGKGEVIMVTRMNKVDELEDAMRFAYQAPDDASFIKRLARVEAIANSMSVDEIDEAEARIPDAKGS